MCKLAIVILNWNGSDMMRKYLPSVVRCSQGEGIKVIVADNGSTDDSLEMLSKEFPEVEVIAMPENYGFAEGYNRALNKIDAKYYLLLNSDVEIRQEGWLTPIINYMDAHPEVGACQPKLIKLYTDKEIEANPNLRTAVPKFEYAGAAGGYIDKYGYPYCRGRIFATVEEDRGQYDEIVPIHWATGAALVVRAEVYKKAGGLDAKFFAHMEEIDLCWRMRIMGYKLVCVSDCCAYHLGGATLNQGNPRKTFLNFRNNRLMLYKNLPDNELNSVLRVRQLLDFVAAMQFLMKGDIANMKAIFKANKEFKNIKPSFKAERERIQAYRKEANIVEEHTNLSILWKYYVKGCKTFSQL